MPIEIKELHIKAVVAAREHLSRGRDEQITGNQYDKMRRELIQECIEKILQIIDKKRNTDGK